MYSLFVFLGSYETIDAYLVTVYKGAEFISLPKSSVNVLIWILQRLNRGSW
jgi:hypothetical protein